MLRIDGAAIVPAAGEFLESGCIVVEGDSIVHVGREMEEKHRQAETVIDAQGMLAIPGLVNAHTHLAMTLMRGYADDMPLAAWLNDAIWPAEGRLEPEDVYWGSMLGAVEMIRGGTTSFADMYWSAAETGRAIEESGLRASLCSVIIGIHPEAERLLSEATDFCRYWNGRAEGRITVMLGPHAPYTCPPAVMERVVALSEELGTGLHIHLSETAAEVRDSIDIYGKSPIAMMDGLGVFERPTLAAHCVHPIGDEISILAKSGTVVVHCPGSNMKLGSGIAPLPEMLRAGVVTALGTDGAASNNNLDMMEEMRLAALLHKAATEDPTLISAPQSLAMATEGGARALRLDRLGRLLPGGLADIVLVDFARPHLTPANNYTSNLVYSAAASDVHTVIVNGRILLREGRFTELDEAEIRARAAERAARLLRSV